MNCSPVRKAYIKGDWIIYIQYLAAAEHSYNINPNSVLKIQQGL